MADPELNVDMESAVADISSDLGFGKQEDGSDHDANADDSTGTGPESTEADPDTGADPDKPDPATTGAPAVRSVPQSWAKEQHERWAKLDPATQDYIAHREEQMATGIEKDRDAARFGATMRDVTAPYMATIQAQGLDAPKAVQFLLNAHHRLTNGSSAERQSYFANLAKSYGLEVPADQAAGAELDPNVRALQDEVRELRTGFTARQQADFNAAQARTASEVQAFAADTAKHPYFDECSDDIVAYINAGHTLEQAYEKAVYANPVTRAKELARIRTDADVSLRAKAKKEADAKRNGSRVNVNAKDTTRSPTAPKGNWEDTMHETMAEIKSRDITH